MRTKNPFCTGTQLAVLRAIRVHYLTRVNEMARLIRMSDATFGHALTALSRAGHIEKDQAGSYILTSTGRYLIKCAQQLEQAKERK